MTGHTTTPMQREVGLVALWVFSGPYASNGPV